MNRLENRLTEMFMLYELGRQTPMPTIEDYSRAPQRATELYLNDPLFHARVQLLAANTLRIIKEEGK